MNLQTKIRNYLVFLWRCGRIAFVGDWRYYAWMGCLSIFVLLGINAWARQFVNGLIGQATKGIVLYDRCPSAARN